MLHVVVEEAAWAKLQPINLKGAALRPPNWLLGKLAYREIRDFRPVPQSSVASRQQYDELPVWQAAADRGGLVYRGKGVIASHGKHRCGNFLEVGGFDHNRLNPHLIALRQPLHPMIGTVRSFSANCSGDQSTDQLGVIPREEQRNIGAVVMSHDVNAAEAELLDDRRRIVCHQFAGESPRAVWTMTMPSLINPDNGATGRDVLPLLVNGGMACSACAMCPAHASQCFKENFARGETHYNSLHYARHD